MSIRFDNRVAIVTGAGAGLGRAHALLLAERGAKVVVNDPGGSVDGRGGSGAVADKVVAEIRAKGGEAVANYDSVGTWEGAQNIVKTAMDKWGRVDALINNAGILRDKAFHNMPVEDFEAVVQVHLLGSAYCTKAAWPIMREQKYGRVVMTTSTSGIFGNFGQSNYGAAKAGVCGLANCLRFEGAKYNIMVNVLSPAAYTRMTENLMNPAVAPYMKPELVSPAAVWLASEACTVSGEIVFAQAGGFTRLQYFETDGVQFDPDQPVTLEMFADAFATVTDLSHAHPLRTIMGEMENKLRAIGKIK
ncbi:MAG TPA: SDR family oxidoreductase [Acetobacteraceae bacterium]|nr:SDR family oxidoreductase [Acetobacteraceae bacterium]